MTYTVINDLVLFLAVSASCGGSDDVRYGRANPETRFFEELRLRPDEPFFVFVTLPRGDRIATRLEWADADWLWTTLASYGIQSADCPTEIWTGSARIARRRNVLREPLVFEDAFAALTHCLAAEPPPQQRIEFRAV